MPERQQDITSPENIIGYTRFIAESKEVIKLTQPLRMDQLGTHVVYYSVVDGQAYASCLIGPLCEFLKEVKINKEAFIDLVAFAFVIPDSTIFENIKTIPPGGTLYPSGEIRNGGILEARPEIHDPQKASQAITTELKKVIHAIEQEFNTCISGLSGGKDTRIIAAIPKERPDNWYFFNIASNGTPDWKGGREIKDLLRIPNFQVVDPPVKGGIKKAYRESSYLVGGSTPVAACSIYDYHVKTYIDENFPELEKKDWVFLSGNMGTELFYPLFSQEHVSLWNCCTPIIDVEIVDSFLSSDLCEIFKQRIKYYESNPFPMDGVHEEYKAKLLMLLTRHRSDFCITRKVQFSHSENLILPFCTPSIIEIALKLSSSLLGSRPLHPLKDIVLNDLRPDLSPDISKPLSSDLGLAGRGPGYLAFQNEILQCFAEEFEQNGCIKNLINPNLYKMFSVGDFPKGQTSGWNLHTIMRKLSKYVDIKRAGYGDKLHGCHAQSIQTIYDVMLSYTTFLNILGDRGVIIRD